MRANHPVGSFHFISFPSAIYSSREAAAAAELSFFKVLSSLSPFEHRIASLALFSNCDLLIVIGMERVRKRRGVAAFFQLSPSYSLLLESLQILLPLLILPRNDIYHRVALGGAMKQDSRSLARSISKFHFNEWGGYIWGFR